MALATTLGDLVTKDWARHALAQHARHVVGPWWWRLSYNTGMSFSMNPSGPRWTSLLTVVVLLVVGYFAWRAKSVVSRVGFGLVLGGGVGNLLDRVTATPPRVTDFVAVGPFPIFNLADAAITVGVVIVLVATWRAAPQGVS
ncbi:MAG: signal peptidase II [Acidobacteriota bacterium]|nr:signal peptidase II [Acidobacteriota bacterium]